MKNLKKFLIVSALVLSLPLIARAQGASIAELEALIRSLQAQLTNLQAQQGSSSTDVRFAPPTTPGKETCGVFTENLKIGSNGKEVSRLHNILYKEGFTVGGFDEVGRAYYGESTASAVSGLQLKYKSEILTPAGLTYGTGIVGIGTRNKLNKLYPKCSSENIPETPSNLKISITASANGLSSENSISTNVGKSFTISGTINNLPKDYQKAFIFSPLFNGSCTNPSEDWLKLECAPKSEGIGTVYLEAYANGQTYRSNTVTVKVSSANTLPPPPTWHQCPFEGQPDSPTCVNPVISSISTTAFTKGQEVEVRGSGFRSSSQIIVRKYDGDPEWFHATRISVSPTSIKFRIDKDIEFGTWEIKVDQVIYTGRGSSNPIQVTILDATKLWSALSIQTHWALPEAKAGNSYTQTITADGGDANYNWSISSGALPEGLRIVEIACRGGVCKTPFTISGTPIKAGSYAFTVMVQSGSQTAVRMFTIVVTEDTPPRDAPAMNITGYLDSVTCDIMGGWAQDMDAPEAQLDIEVWSLMGGNYWKKIHTAKADAERSDVGKHAFGFFTPSELKDGRIHSIYVYAKGAKIGEYTKLVGSGASLVCGGVSQKKSSNLVANSFEMIKNLFGNLLNR